MRLRLKALAEGIVVLAQGHHFGDDVFSLGVEVVVLPELPCLCFAPFTGLGVDLPEALETMAICRRFFWLSSKRFIRRFFFFFSLWWFYDGWGGL